MIIINKDKDLVKEMEKISNSNLHHLSVEIADKQRDKRPNMDNHDGFIFPHKTDSKPKKNADKKQVNIIRHHI